MEIRETRPWFWVLVAALAVVAIAALVIAVSASNESVDQKKIADEVTAQIEGEIAGLDKALKAADELQAESSKQAERNHNQISKEVEEVVAGGGAELEKLGRRVKKLEGEAASLTAADKSLEKSVSGLSAEKEKLEGQVEALEADLAKLEKQAEKAGGK
ncbi:MAG: hypothetical protein JST31_01225 [Actinobacteria bacterium]|nr:hypothetical protein [Actinomycetota bacterium]